MTTTPWTRPSLDVVAPDRSFGNLYRLPERTVKGTTLGGIPLQSASDAVVATVQLGYKVADRQIDRGRKLTRSLQRASKRAGVDGTQALDATEGLIMRALLLALEWMEGAAAGPSHPVRRVLAAEYKLFGAMLGLGTADTTAKEPRSSAGSGSEGASRSDAGGSESSPGQSARSVPAGPVRAAANPVIRHVKDSAQRSISVIDYVLTGKAPPGTSSPLRFYPAAGGDKVLHGKLILASPDDVLEIKTLGTHAPGRWRAAICLSDGLQIGRIDVEL